MPHTQQGQPVVPGVPESESDWMDVGYATDSQLQHVMESRKGPLRFQTGPRERSACNVTGRSVPRDPNEQEGTSKKR